MKWTVFFIGMNYQAWPKKNRVLKYPHVNETFAFVTSHPPVEPQDYSQEGVGCCNHLSPGLSGRLGMEHWEGSSSSLLYPPALPSGCPSVERRLGTAAKSWKERLFFRQDNDEMGPGKLESAQGTNCSDSRRAILVAPKQERNASVYMQPKNMRGTHA